MSKVRIYGDTSGYVDIAVPAVAGTRTLNLDKVPQTATNGNTGIGTDNPSQNLHVSSSDHTRVLVTAGTDKYAELQFENDAQKFAMGVQNDDKFFLYNSTGTSQVLTVDTSSNIGLGTQSPFTKFHAKDTGWSSGSPYGSVALIEGNNVNDTNWGHLVITDTTTATGNGGAISFATGASTALNPFSGIKGVSEGASWGGIGFYSRPQSGTATRRMTIDSAGNVGIGYTGPNEKLHVNGYIEASSGFKLASHPVLIYDGFDGGYATRLGSTGTSTLNATQIYAGGSLQATFKGGNVGIGTTNGDVTSDGTASRTYVGIIGSGNRGRLNLGSTAANGADSGVISFVNGANELGSINVDTNSGVQNAGKMYITSSDDILVRSISDITYQTTYTNSTAGHHIFKSYNTEIMRIDGANNRVGIGTDGPTENLEIKTSGPAFKLTDTANSNNNIKMSQGYNSYLTASNNVYMSAGGHTDMLSLLNGAVQVKKTRSGLITGGTSDTGAVIKLHTEAQWEGGYGNNALATTNDYLGSIEFSTGDSSTGEGVRAAIRGTVDSYYNQNSIVMETAPGATAAEPIERMRVWHNGIVTKPYTPSFSCYKNGNQTEQTGNVNVTGWSENFDQGNNVNNTSGIFTAPVAGKYYFTFNAMHSGTMAGDAQYKIYHNGVYYQGSNDTQDGSNWDQCTVVAIIDMAANDTANPVAYSSATNANKPAVYTSRYSGWMGFLIG